MQRGEITEGIKGPALVILGLSEAKTRESMAGPGAFPSMDTRVGAPLRGACPSMTIGDTQR